MARAFEKPSAKPKQFHILLDQRHQELLTQIMSTWSLGASDTIRLLIRRSAANARHRKDPLG